jgi:hypothetical protein
MRKWPKQTFLKQKYKMANSYMKKIINEMQIKTTMRYYCMLVREAIIKKIRGRLFANMWRKGNPCTWGGCKLEQPLWKTVWNCFKIIKNRTTT